ncbi:MAG: putative sulfate/molybdate transporter [Actinomycetota bacterium]
MSAPTHPFRVGLGEASGAVADLGIFVPLATALILVNGLDAGAVLVCAGLLVISAGVVFQIPFPVQPLKALTAIAVAQELSPATINAAGIELGAILLLLTIGGTGARLSSWFTPPVIRALQFGVGILLAIGAWRLIARPPAVFQGVPSRSWILVLAVAAFLGVWMAARSGRSWFALVVLIAGIAATIVAAQPDLAAPSLSLPSFAIPDTGAFASAFFLLVVPQIPLTFGNAVVAVDHLAHQEFGERARRVSVPRVLLLGGVANLVTGVLGGMPMCHGSGGLTAHVRLGAKTAGMNLLLGGTFLSLGLLFAGQVPALLGLLPVWVLGGFLAYAGLRHALLVTDLTGADLAVAIAAGALGAWLGNLAVTAGVALVAVHARRLFGPNRRAPDTLNR